jgi:hypothetical protein
LQGIVGQAANQLAAKNGSVSVVWVTFPVCFGNPGYSNPISDRFSAACLKRSRTSVSSSSEFLTT